MFTGMVPPPSPPTAPLSTPVCPHVEPAVHATLTVMADRLTLNLHDAALAEPSREDGRATSAYARGLADGMSHAITCLREAARCVVEHHKAA
jgi:hypothetical protein